MTKKKRLEAIYNSFLNGQNKQAVKQLEEYGLYSFWDDFRDSLGTLHGGEAESRLRFFSDCVIIYFNITQR